MKKRLSKDLEKMFWREIRSLEKESRVRENKKFFQHGNTTIYKHCLWVTYTSCLLAQNYSLPVAYKSLIRGAFLHDYFLYDWHDRNHVHKRPHGFYHPQKALENAMEDFTLTWREQNIIKRHMFPLTPVPPACMEAWVVCVADKICSTKETLKKRERRYKNV